MAYINIPRNIRSWTRGAAACAMAGMLCAAVQACADGTATGDLEPGAVAPADSVTHNPPLPPQGGGGNAGGVDVWFDDWDGQEDHEMPF